MYTEEYENRGFPFRNFLLKLILIIIFVFLLVWLLPKFIAPSINNNIKNNTVDNKGINALTSQIFQNNLEKMKEAAISYYTDERLPKEDGEFKQMTLSEMIGLKLITPLIDKNNKAVDVEKSYVKITKSGNEYILKVNIKDSEKEDYILVHLGCYTYCDSTICEKKETEVVIKGSIVNDKTPIVKKYYCQIVNGKYYSKSGNVVNKATYDSECNIKPPKQDDKYSCVKVNGKYYDKSGSIVDKKTFDKSCNSKEKDKYSCVKANGKYYDKDGNEVDKETFEEKCNTKPKEDKYYCEIVDGKYYDKFGNVVDKDAYEKSCKSIPEKEYIYEYARTKNAQFSSWTAWSSWLKTNCNTKAITCAATDVNCLREVKLYNRKEKIGTHKQYYTKERTVQITSGSYQEKTCANYNYVIVNNTTYAVTTTYASINNVTSSTASSVAGWTYNGRKSFKNPPRDTTTKHYIFVGADYSYCSDVCTTLPNFYYDEYTYTGTMQNVASTTTPISSGSGVMASCGSYVTKTVYLYSNITVSEMDSRTEPLYGTVCYSSDRTRKLESKGKTETKWSHYNDTELLNNNWYYTGNKKVKESK